MPRIAFPMVGNLRAKRSSIDYAYCAHRVTLLLQKCLDSCVFVPKACFFSFRSEHFGYLCNSFIALKLSEMFRLRWFREFVHDHCCTSVCFCGIVVFSGISPQYLFN